jgi:hypothetical protein
MDPIAILDTAAEFRKIAALKRQETTVVQPTACSFTMCATKAHFNILQI